MLRYFAYGANMDQQHVRATARAARPLGLGVLPDHRVVVAAAGYGTLVDDPGHTVHGFLWELTPADIAALDEFEGVPDGLYRQEQRVVQDEQGRSLPAMVYVATDPAFGRAEPSYIATIVAAGRAVGLPEQYLREINLLPTTLDRSAADRWVRPAERPKHTT